MKKYWIVTFILLMLVAGGVLYFRPAAAVPPAEPPAIDPAPPQAQPPVPVAGPYPKGSKGFAISYPQCGKPYPAEYDFGILGVTKGYSLTKNPCLKSEIEWAKQGKYPPAFYFNLSYPTNLTKEQPFAFGYRTAKEAHEYAVEQGAGPAHWWIDAQIISSWSDDTSANAQTALGAIAYFKEQGLPVGLSTTPYQWNTITGSLQTGLPTWVPGRVSLEQYCKTGASYSNGPLQQTANVNSDDFEAVLACGE